MSVTLPQEIVRFLFKRFPAKLLFQKRHFSKNERGVKGGSLNIALQLSLVWRASHTKKAVFVSSIIQSVEIQPAVPSSYLSSTDIDLRTGLTKTF